LQKSSLNSQSVLAKEYSKVLTRTIDVGK